MDDVQLQLLVDLHKSQSRQGPGGEAETKRAMELAGLDRSRHLKIADIGCGTGASTILLASELDAEMTAVDFLPELLDELQARAKDHGVDVGHDATRKRIANQGGLKGRRTNSGLQTRI